MRYRAATLKVSGYQMKNSAECWIKKLKLRKIYKLTCLYLLHWINHYVEDKLIRKVHCIIHWIEIMQWIALKNPHFKKLGLRSLKPPSVSFIKKWKVAQHRVFHHTHASLIVLKLSWERIQTLCIHNNSLAFQKVSYLSFLQVIIYAQKLM